MPAVYVNSEEKISWNGPQNRPLCLFRAARKLKENSGRQLRCGSKKSRDTVPDQVVLSPERGELFAWVTHLPSPGDRCMKYFGADDHIHSVRGRME